MLLDFKYMKYLERIDNEYKIKETTSKRVRKEINKINKMYEKNYGEKLIRD